ncbi:MAG: signal peptidase I [Tissierellia bacterium]|nr:signal peptidase I [Tissierellia bacterium]
MSKVKLELEKRDPLDIIKMKKRKVYNRQSFFSLIGKLFGLTIVAYLVFNLVFGITLIKNNDMSPRMSASDLLVYYRLDKNYIAGDVVVAYKNETQYVSRVVATAGDTVDIDENGLLINGAYQVSSNIYYQTGIYEDGIKFPVTIGSDEVFLLGDLREGAKDSRYFGPVKLNEVKGKIFVLLRRTQF